MQAFSTALVGTSFQLAARDSGQRPQSILSLAERSDSKVMSMHKEMSVKSRVRGDFHARFCERVRVKLPRSTRPMTLPTHDYTGLYQLLRTQSVESVSLVTIPLGRKVFAIAQKYSPSLSPLRLSLCEHPPQR